LETGGKFIGDGFHPLPTVLRPSRWVCWRFFFIQSA
jgi:hypothetical protein